MTEYLFVLSRKCRRLYFSICVVSAGGTAVHFIGREWASPTEVAL
jgi:hypothetical protein